MMPGEGERARDAGAREDYGTDPMKSLEASGSTNDNDRIAAALARVHAITWDQPDRNDREGSQIALMFEFLRRMALWYEALRGRSRWPFFSVAEAIAAGSGNVRAILERPEMVSIESAVGRLLSHPRHICTWYVQWSAIEALDEVRAFGLPEPYQPALLIFERGGLFSIEQGMFQFFLASFPVGTIARNRGRPPLALDDASLAQQDARWRHDTDEARARAIIEAFFIEGKNKVVRIEREPDRVIVKTLDMWWRVHHLDGESTRLSLDGYALFAVAQHVSRYPPILSHGVARLPDGRMFLLDEPEQFRAFYAAMGGALPPADLAGLLVRFQLGSITAPSQHLITALDDLAEELEPEQIQAIPELIPLQVTQREDGGVVLDFCAYLRGRRGDPDSGWIRVVRWRVEATGAQGLTWSFRTIAERLPPRRWKDLGMVDIIPAREKE